MRKLLLTSLLSTVLLTLSTSSYAVIQTVEPDDFPATTDISNSFPNVTLSTASGGSVFSVEVTNTTASTGTRGFSGSTSDLLAGFESASTPDPFSTAGLDSPGQVIRADFTTPTNFVSIDVIPNDGSDPSRLAVYDAAGNLLQVIDEPGVGVADIPVTLSITRPTADIAFILASGVNGDNVALDNLQFDFAAVSPATAIPTLSEWTLILLMLSLGFVGVRLTRKQRF